VNDSCSSHWKEKPRHKKVKFYVSDFSQSGIERVQALADISYSALCCHNNETCAPIANPPNSAQLEGILVTAVCVSVCLSLAAFSHYCTDPDITGRMVGGAV